MGLRTPSTLVNLFRRYIFYYENNTLKAKQDFVEFATKSPIQAHSNINFRDGNNSGLGPQVLLKTDSNQLSELLIQLDSSREELVKSLCCEPN